MRGVSLSVRSTDSFFFVPGYPPTSQLDAPRDAAKAQARMKRPSPAGLDEALDEPHKAQALDPQARTSVPPSGSDGSAAAGGEMKVQSLTFAASLRCAASLASCASPTCVARHPNCKQAWADGQRFGTDERGEEQLLDENGTQVMMAWERPYMVRCIDALRITEADSVLEVGLGSP